MAIVLRFKNPINFSERDRNIFYFLNETEEVKNPTVNIFKHSLYQVGKNSILKNGITKYLKILMSYLSIRYRFKYENSPCVLITDRYSSNYFHWISEALPKLTLLREKGFFGMVVLPVQYKDIPYVISSLEMLGWENRFYSNNVILSSPCFYIPDDTAQSGSQHPVYFIQARDLLLNSCHTKDSRLHSKIVFINRQESATRRIQNWDEIKIVLENFGIAIINLEENTLQEQIQLMQTAEILIGVHGAGLTNMCFMRPGSKVVEIRRDDDKLNYCYFKLANTCKVNYYYLLAKSTGKSDNIQQDDLYLPKTKLIELLNSLN